MAAMPLPLPDTYMYSTCKFMLIPFALSDKGKMFCKEEEFESVLMMYYKHIFSGIYMCTCLSAKVLLTRQPTADKAAYR